MGIITGYLLVLIIVLLCVKFIAKRSGRGKLDHLLMRIHKPIAYVGLVLAIVHFILTLQVFKTRPIFLYIGGILIVVLGITSGITYTCAKKLGKRWILLHRLLALSTLILVAFHMIVYFEDFSDYHQAIEEINVTDIDTSTIKDGTYIGSYDAGYIYAKVQVTITQGKITVIKIEKHNNERGKRAEQITERIKEQQRITVDTISGATNSSKVIQQAIVNALENKAQ